MSNNSTWNHITLYGCSVGNFTATPASIQWQAFDNENSSENKIIPKGSLIAALWTVFGRSGHLAIQCSLKDKRRTELRFEGFKVSDLEKLKSTFQALYDIPVYPKKMSSTGASYGNLEIPSQESKLVLRETLLENEEEAEEGEELLSLNLHEVSQCALPGNNRNEFELQFHESDAVDVNTDQVVQIRFYVPPEEGVDYENSETPAEVIQKKIMEKAHVKGTTGSIILSFPEEQGTFLTPRGRYAIELYDSFLRLRGAKYDYKILYEDVSKLFLLPKPDDLHVAFVIALDKPIRQGQQRYQYLILQTTKEQAEVNIQLDEETIEKDYNGDLQPIMYGALSNLVAKTFKIITKKKVFIPGKFSSATSHSCVKCALRANEGLLYPLEKQFIFIHKPATLVRFDEILSVEFQRYSSVGSNRNFDLVVTLKKSALESTHKEYNFSGIDRSEYSALFTFLSGKKIKIKNIQEAEPAAARTDPVYNEDEIYGFKADGMGEDSEDDESYGSGDANASSSDDSDSEGGSDDESAAADDDSDLEEARKNAAKEKKRKKSQGEKKKNKDSDDSDDESDKEEETPKKKKSRKAAVPKKEAPKRKKKDPNAPKRAMSAYLYFNTENREKIKAEHPGVTFGELGKLIGEKYKTLTEDEKKKYLDMAEKDKARYAKEMEEYKAKQAAENAGKNEEKNDSDDSDDDSDSD